jgi:methylamine--corrinoid protein Co-methyltransferase
MGPLCSAEEWNNRIIPTKVSQKLKEHDLRGTFSSENPVNTDDTLADEFFKAGVELAIEVGLHCQDTERVVKVTEEEFKDAITQAPDEISLGEGRDRVVMKNRKPEDLRPPLIISPLSVVISEDIWVPLHQGIAQHREIDIFQGGSVVKMFGHPVLAGTPYETLAGRYQAQLTREALWRAGRPGMPTTAVISSATAFGQLGGFGIKSGFDPVSNIALILSAGEMQTSYSTLHKVAHSINCESRRFVASAAMIGGYAGPPEGAALTQIAACLLHFVVHQADCSGGSTTDIRYGGTNGPEGIWATSVANQAISRNTHLLRVCAITQKAGACTEMLLYESAVAMMSVSASGAASTITPRTAGGEYPDCLTPLECKFCGGVLKRSAGMSRKKVNEIAKMLIPRYQDKLMHPPRGKSFRECYDLQTLKPAQEWFDMYLRVKKELVEFGVPLEHM